MGFEKFPHIPNLGQSIERSITENVANMLRRRKDGMPPTSAAIPAVDARKTFSHMYSAYVVCVTGSLQRCHNEQQAMKMTINGIQPYASMGDWEVSEYTYKGHFACLVNPDSTLKAKYDASRTKYGYPIPTDPLFYAYIFDPWCEKSPNVHTIQNWQMSYGG